MIISNNIYNISSYSNLLSIIRSGNVITIGIPPGTYTINELISELNDAWTG